MVDNLVPKTEVEEASQEVTPTTDQPGTPAAAGATQSAGGNGMEGESLEQVEARVREELEQDFNRLRSSYDSKISDIQKDNFEIKSSLEQQLNEAVTKNMTVEQRTVHEKSLEANKVSELEKQNAELQLQIEAKEMADGWKTTFKTRFDIDLSDKVNASPQEIVAEGFARLEKKQADLLAGSTASPEQPANPGATPPEVQLGMPEGNVGVITLTEFAKKFGGKEAMYQAVEQGRLQMKDIPGFEGALEAQN